MAHIELQNDLPGIRGLMVYSPDTAKPLNALAEILLHDDNNSLSKGERTDRRLCIISQQLLFLPECARRHGSALPQLQYGRY